MPLKALTLDLWLTLIYDTKELEDYRKLRRLVNFYRFVNRIHKDRGVEPMSLKYNDVRLAMEELAKKAEVYYKKGEDLHPKDRGQMLFSMLGVKVEPNSRQKVYESAGRLLSNSGYMRRLPHVNPEALPTLRAFKAAYPNLKICLISNAARSGETYRRILNQLRIGKYFDLFVISCEVGYLKPRKEIFSRALELLRVEPKETLHIGDLFSTDVLGATSSGMNVCLYSGLWHKYAQYTNPGEHIPKDFKPRNRKLVVEEIERLQQALEVAKKIS